MMRSQYFCFCRSLFYVSFSCWSLVSVCFLFTRVSFDVALIVRLLKVARSVHSFFSVRHFCCQRHCCCGQSFGAGATVFAGANLVAGNTFVAGATVAARATVVAGNTFVAGATVAAGATIVAGGTFFWSCHCCCRQYFCCRCHCCCRQHNCCSCHFCVCVRMQGSLAAIMCIYACVEVCVQRSQADAVGLLYVCVRTCTHLRVITIMHVQKCKCMRVCVAKQTRWAFGDTTHAFGLAPVARPCCCCRRPCRSDPRPFPRPRRFISSWRSRGFNAERPCCPRLRSRPRRPRPRLGPVRPRRCYLLLSAVPLTAQPGHWAVQKMEVSVLFCCLSLFPSITLSLTRIHTHAGEGDNTIVAGNTFFASAAVVAGNALVAVATLVAGYIVPDVTPIWMIHSYGRRDSFICATWLIYMGVITYSYEWHDSFKWTTSKICMSVMSYSYEWHFHMQHDTFIWATFPYATWLIHAAISHETGGHNSCSALIRRICWMLHAQHD